MKDFSGKVAVITGGASGVGLNLGLRLAAAGAKIVLADIEKDALEAAVSQVRAAGGEVIGQPADVARREQVDALRDRAFEAFGAVHLVFNNAGVGGGGGVPLWETPEKSYRWMMDVNFFGPLNGILSFMPKLIEQDQEALMASTSSGAGIIFPPTAPAYSASKAALIALMEILAQQLKGAGSKVKAAILFPGPYVVDTNLFNSHRNLQTEYLDPSFDLSRGINTMSEFQGLMKQLIGREAETTSPKDFAEEVYQSLLRDEFYILPLNEGAKNAVRERYEIMIARGQPVMPNMF
ncbi:SDR family NAD(P)-dependent oxidoreductase [Phenylobacterium sp.]|uniref:SDR family NAD(P)-dependent oxidoreductase n=1 Tax=Phenylobacterium sp. TaxID=1871053 RepID=UPI002F424DD9